VDPETRDAARWMARWLHDVRPDAIVAPYLNGPWGKALMALRRPPRPIVGFDQDCGLEHQRHYERLSVRVHKNLELHEKANLKRLFEWAGLPCEPRPAELRPDPAALTRARSCPFVADAPRGAPLVMFNPDAGHAQKEWPDERWAELTRLALDRTDWRIVINASRPRAELEERVAAIGPVGRAHWLR
jgi:ADP-heptose:LPS heptosyltransferase